MLRYLLIAYVAIFLVALCFALGFQPSAVIPVAGFFLLIFPTFLLCVAVLVLTLRSLPFAAKLQLPAEFSFLPFRKG